MTIPEEWDIGFIPDLLSAYYDKLDEEQEKEYIDQPFGLKEMVVSYRDSQYKKKIKAVINSGQMTDCDVGRREKVSAYLRVLRRSGKVKGFTPSIYGWLEGIDSFC